MMSTKKLAKELGLIRQRSKSSNGSKKLLSNQIFSYLIVIDFESTCWREKNNYGQEIIEFPAVLLNTSTGKVESEFHTYVQPQEHPNLSEFCTELTGITQMQVEAGIPLQICLSRFNRWLQNLQLEKGLVFPNRQQRSSAASPSQKLCTFLTWSDWDLGVCLQYECKRKQLHKPDVLNSWIDLRSTYRLFYDRKPKGLNGALQDLGIGFQGREHSGLDDSRNTAQLAARMMRDGCVMKITKSLERMPSVKHMFGNTDNQKENPNTQKGENTSTTNKPSSKIPSKSCQIKPSSGNVSRDLYSKQKSFQMFNQSLIAPKTLLNGLTKPLWGSSRSSVTQQAVANISSPVIINHPSPLNNNDSLALCSMTVGCETGATAGNEEELLVETEDRCGSYDDVVLEGDDGFISESEGEFHVDYVSDFDSGCHVWEQPADTVDPAGGQATNSFKSQKKTIESSVTYLPTKKINVSDIRQHSTISEPESYFALPKTVIWDSKSNQQKTRLGTSLQVQEKSNGSHETSKTITPSLLRLKPFIPENTSTPFTSFARPKAVITQHSKPTPNSSFSIYTDPAKPSCPSSFGSFCVPKNLLSSLSTNTLSSRTNRSSISATMKGAQRITSPLCGCGRRARRQVVSNGGPNHGRGFFCCPVRRSDSGCRIQKGCEFFKWESALIKSRSVSAPAVGSSVSLCQINSTLSRRPPLRSTQRKSY